MKKALETIRDRAAEMQDALDNNEPVNPEIASHIRRIAEAQIEMIEQGLAE